MRRSEDGGAGPEAMCAKVERLRQQGVEVWSVPAEDGSVDLRELVKRLGERGIDSVLLEGGRTLNESALRAGIVQEVNALSRPRSSAEGQVARQGHRRGGAAGGAEDENGTVQAGQARSADHLRSRLIRCERSRTMFTGIVEEKGTVKHVSLAGISGSIAIRARKVLGGTRDRDSIAVNGVCLTVVSLQSDSFGRCHGRDDPPDTVWETASQATRSTSSARWRRTAGSADTS